MLAQQPLHGGALHALAPAMDETHLAKSRLVRGTQIGVDHVDDIPRRKAVKIDRVFDGDVDRRLVFHC